MALLLIRSRCFTLARILCSLCLCSSALAAAEGGQPGQEVLRLQQQQQRAVQQLQLEQRQRQLKRTGSGAQSSVTPEPVLTAQEVDCWPIQGIRLAGVTLFRPAVLEARIKPIVAPCMGINRINHLLAEITRLYVEAGYIVARPYLGSTPSAGQPLDIRVDEGYVETIELADQSLPLSLRTAFPAMLGAPLNLRDLEQGLDQLNRLRSVDVTADVAPGSVQGASRIILRSNAGQPHWGLDLSLDSPFQLNDALNLGFSETLNHGPRFSRSNSLFYSVPYGYWTLSAFASHIEYRAPIKLSTTTLYGSGRTDQP